MDERKWLIYQKNKGALNLSTRTYPIIVDNYVDNFRKRNICFVESVEKWAVPSIFFIVDKM